MIVLYEYKKQKDHTKADTDNRILESVEAYAASCGLPLSTGVSVFRTADGKPYLCGMENAPYIGATHSEETLFIGVGNVPFGLDCEEKDREVSRYEKLMARFFSARECAYINEVVTEQRPGRFLDVWVKKEAYVKFLGTGLRDIAATDTFTVGGCFTKIPHNTHILYVYTK